MADLRAIKLLKDAEKVLKSHKRPPDDFSVPKTGKYAKKTKKILGSTRETITSVTNYMQLVNNNMTELVKELHALNKIVEESIAKALAAVRENQRHQKFLQSDGQCTSILQHSGGQCIPKTSVQENVVLNSTNIQVARKNNNYLQDNNKMKRLLLLQMIAEENSLLQQFIVESQEVFEMPEIPEAVLDTLDDCFQNWRNQADRAFMSEQELKEEKAKQERKRKEEAEKEMLAEQERKKQQFQTTNSNTTEDNQIETENDDTDNDADDDDKLRMREEERKRLEEEEEEKRRQEEEARRKEEEIQRLKEEEEEKKRREEEEARRKEEEIQRLKEEEEEKKRREEEEARRKEEEIQRLKEEEEEKKRREEEEARRKEEEIQRLKEEEEEKKRREEEEARRKEEEIQRLKEEEEEKKRREEEEARRKEEEIQRLKEEEEEKKRRKEEERRRKEMEAQNLREEAEKRRKEEKERKRLEDEQRKKKEEMRRLEEERKQRLDPKNWSFIIYRAKTDAVYGYKRYSNLVSSDAVDGVKDTDPDVCCVVSAPNGSIRKADLCCTIVDIDFTDQTNPTEDDERIVSPIISLRSERGEINTEAPLQVFLPHVYINEEIDEVVVKSAAAEGEWITKHTIKPAKFVDELDSRKNENLVGMEINSFTYVKIVVVARKKRTRLTAGEVGGKRLVSNDDGDGIIQLIIPRGAFSTDTELETLVQPVHKDSLESVSDGRATVTRVILIYCEHPPTKSLTLEIEKNKNKKKAEDVHYTTIKTDGEWEFADFQVKNNTNSVDIPPDKRKYSVIEVYIPQNIQSDKALGVAEAIHGRINSIPVKMVLKQSQDNPHDAVIQCVPSIQEETTVNDLIKHGFSMGPDVSCEFFIREGTKIDISCFGNVRFVNETKIGLVFLTYLNFVRRRVTFEACNQYYEREYRCFSGGVVYKFHDRRSTYGLTDTISSLTQSIVLPKGNSTHERILGNLKPEMIGLAKFLSLHLIENCPDWQVVLTNLCGASKDATMKTAPTNDDGFDLWTDQELCRRIVIDWMKSRPSSFNKLAHVRNVLVSSGYPDLAAPCTDFVNNFKDFLNDKETERIMALVHMDAVEVSDRLGLTDDEIDDIFTEFHDENRDKAAALIYGWRFTDTAVLAGVKAVDKLKAFLGVCN